MAFLKEGQKVSVKIDRLATGGFGVGRYEGMVIFVPYTAPGEVVDVTITEVKKNFSFAEVKKVHLASDHRVKPKCKHYGECGGCNWQHVEYSEQLKQKQEILEWIFRNHHVKADKIVPSPDPWNYRRRVQLHQADGKVGFLKRQSHEVVPIKSCPITREEILNEWPQKTEAKWGEKFEIGVDDDKKVYRAPLNETTPEFSQVNEQQNENLKEIVVAMARRFDTTAIFDLYSGSGNFAFAVAEANPLATVVGVDSSSALVEKGKLLAKQKKIMNVEFLKMKDSEIHEILNFSGAIVILDPPRSGCSPELLDKILNEKPAGLIYVSCHPQTAERDIQILSKNYRLEALVPLDMFPQTDHIEMVGLLR